MSKLQQSFRFVQDTHCDRTGAERVLVKKDTTFTATMVPLMRRKRATPYDPMPEWEPVPGMFEVETADIDVMVGCLTSCIRVQWAVPTGAAKEI